MKLEFEIIEEVQAGPEANIVQFWDNQLQLYYIKNGQVVSKITRIENEDWSNLEWVREAELLPAKNVTHLNIGAMFENMIIGTYLDGNNQRLVVYEF